MKAIPLFLLTTLLPAAAQDELLPTHVAGPGQGSVTLRLRDSVDAGTYGSGVFGFGDLDYVSRATTGTLEGSVGIAPRIEVEGSWFYQLKGETETSSGGTGSEQTIVGLGDLELRGNYLLTAESPALPQFMAGVILVLPAGDRNIGTPRTAVGGVVFSQGEDSGPGDGAVKIGAQAGASLGIADVTLYALAAYRHAIGKHEDAGEELTVPDRVRLALGAAIPIGRGAIVDVRAHGEYVGVEENRGYDTSAYHFDMGVEAFVYYPVGVGAVLVAGAGGGRIQDHDLDKTFETSLEGVTSYDLEVGLHFPIGAP